MTAAFLAYLATVQPVGMSAGAEPVQRFTGTLSDRWNCPIIPQGGVLTAFGTRAVELALEAAGVVGQPIRSVHTVFAGKVAHGPDDSSNDSWAAVREEGHGA